MDQLFVMKRRQILSTIGMTGLIGLSGCGVLFGTRTELAGILVGNLYSGTADVDLRVEQAGEMVLEETITVKDDGGETVACSWDRESEEPIIEARLADDGDWNQLNLAETDEETVHVDVIVRPGGGVSFGVIGSDETFFVDLCAQEE